MRLRSGGVVFTCIKIKTRFITVCWFIISNPHPRQSQTCAMAKLVKLPIVSVDAAVKCGAALCLIVFVWEYAVVDIDTNIRPSVLLTFIADNVTAACERLGTMLAWLSSFYTYIAWDKLSRTVERLFTPIWSIAMSWLYVAWGYFSYIHESEINPTVVWIGTVTLCALLCGAIGYTRYCPAILRRMVCAVHQLHQMELTAIVLSYCYIFLILITAYGFLTYFVTQLQPIMSFVFPFHHILGR